MSLPRDTNRRSFVDGPVFASAVDIGEMGLSSREEAIKETNI
jgi:hypothetical protein